MKGKDLRLEILSVDFGNAEEVCRFASLTIQAASDAGLFMARSSLGRRQKEIRLAAVEWVSRVEASIDTMTAGDALRVICPFDLIHRIAFGKPAAADYLDRYRLGAFKAFIHGDGSVDRYELFHTLSVEIARRNRKYLGHPLEWVSLCLDRWHRNFLTGVSTTPQSGYDTIRQLTALLGSDLRAFEKDQDSFKRRLVANHPDCLTDALSVPSYASACPVLGARTSCN